MNEVIKAIKRRRSYRSYTDKKISKNILKEIIDCARLAPTAINVQPSEFVVITNKEMLKKVADITDYGKFIKNAAACIIVLCKETKYYLEDGCAATENILIAAESFSIGSCWVAGDKKAYCKKILELIGAPETYKVVSILSLGYYDKPIEAHGKRKLKGVIHWEKF
ncbi:nitroreductase [Euryarchaeota archaeon SM23-78]|nr:MAG: nitroreductase [Euryarchaeota archaeon SM23-78]MBW3000831.1 nitroreductase family protein [Candidatus Woesearchaeota archaeon]